MHDILAKDRLSPNVTRLEVNAARIAQIRQSGQFVIVDLHDGSERIPLTIADAEEEGIRFEMLTAPTEVIGSEKR